MIVKCSGVQWEFSSCVQILNLFLDCAFLCTFPELKISEELLTYSFPY